ncbi:hypothetical protein BVC80_7351g9 [Macleaya cordata]|uniref:RRM domain-containing protein n=1 Tax=Macleaya cordata TaxID=56857 RepID=A0A200QRK8_MACCD|nr:hypothetical protein BVC80_7351g9 [Macleaya cordata]
MASKGTTDDLLRGFYLMECHLFSRLIGRMRRPIVLARLVIAVWLLLEELGFYDLIQKLYGNVDSVVEAIFDETASCLKCMDPINGEQPRGINDTPFLEQILDEPMNRRFFYFNRDILLNRVTYIMKTVCTVIFDENTAKQVEDNMVHPVVRGVGEGSNTQVRLLPSDQNPIHSSSTLNPFARQFTLREAQWISPDHRSMFLTFSNGYPLSREEIIHFFTLNWGPVVEDVLMERTPDDNNPPQYGRIIFTHFSVIDNILNGQPKVKFVVNRKHLWARVFVPKRK